MLTLVVFTMDRALQCDSLLRSVKDNCRGIDSVEVIYKTTSKLHSRAYTKLVDTWAGDVVFWPQVVPLGYCLNALLRGSDNVAIAVDDMLFHSSSDFTEASRVLEQQRGFVWSWRLSYKPIATKLCGEIRGGDFCGDFWRCSPFVDDRDYAYMFHSDGALYRTRDYLELLHRYLPGWAEPKARPLIPNDLESAVMASFRRWAGQVGSHLGPPRATCMTWQLNKVSSTIGVYGAPACEDPRLGLDVLAEAYIAGKHVDNQRLYDDLTWTTRFNPPTSKPTHVFPSQDAAEFYLAGIK